jgi:hypothetical protein
LPFSLTGPGGRKRRAAAGWSESPDDRLSSPRNNPDTLQRNMSRESVTVEKCFATTQSPKKSRVGANVAR